MTARDTATAAPAQITDDASAALMDQAISRAGQLATLPSVALEIMRLAESATATGDQLSHVLASDPALSARVLKIVNSAYYGQRREVASIDAAVVVLGFAAVKNIAVAAGLARMFRIAPLSTGFEPQQLWTHAIAVATAARMLAARLRGVEPQEAFLAGLLHDIGMIVELQACQSGFLATIVSSATDATRPFREWETEHIGVTHEAMGAALCRAWRFPASLQNVAGFHHRPMELPAESRRLPALVHVADHLAARAALGVTQSVAHEPLQPEVLEWLGLPSDELDAFCAALPAHVADVTPMLSGGT